MPSATYLSQTFQPDSAEGAEIRTDQTQDVPASTIEVDTDADAPHDTDADDVFVASLVQFPEESVAGDDDHSTTLASSQIQDKASTAPLTLKDRLSSLPNPEPRRVGNSLWLRLATIQFSANTLWSTASYQLRATLYEGLNPKEVERHGNQLTL